MSSDTELLRRYVAGDDASFTELVNRHLTLVYSAALRLVNGRAQFAEEVTQDVFTDLARKAPSLSLHPTLVGWLHTSTRFRAANVVRGEMRRQIRETGAALMSDANTATEINWEQLRPLLDEAVGELGELDRNVVLLRFFQGKSYPEIESALGLRESTVHKRLERALEKIRRHFSRRGVTTTAALLGSAISAHAAVPPPLGLAAKVAGHSLAGVSSLPHLAGKTFIMTIKPKFLTAAVIIALLVALTLGLPHWQNAPAQKSSGLSQLPPIASISTNRPGEVPVASPAALPAPSGTASVVSLMPTPWALNVYLTSDALRDVGADTPENALQTVYWARKTGNKVREAELMLTETVFIEPSQAGTPGKPNTTQVKAVVTPALDYNNLIGGKVIRSKVISDNVVEINVNEDWIGTSDTIQEWFQFRKVDGQWKYTQTVTIAD